MLSRRFRREGAEQTGKTMRQDGFSARVTQDAPQGTAAQPEQAAQVSSGMQDGAVPGVTARPWRDQPDTRAGAQSSWAACTMAAHRVLEFADNGDGTLTVVRCMDLTADDLDIQFEAGACAVTAIAPHAFERCTALRRVTLPQGLRQIGEMAFSGCAHLSCVVIPGSVQRVGTLAFAKCTGLERVRIEPGVQALGPSCFSKCTSLKRVDVPESLATMGGGVFVGCGKQLCLYGAENTPAQQYARLNGLRFDSQSWQEDEELVLREQEDGSLVVMGPRQEAPVRIEIPSELCGRRIAAIAPKAFFACGTLRQLSVGSSVREIGESAFFGCRSLSVASFERGLERVGDSAFAGCESLTQITLPWGTGAVGRMAFFGCTRLAFVKMPTTTRVSDFAFDGCAPNLRVFGGVNAGRTGG